MSEPMTVETIVEAHWRLQNYWTRLRFPFQTEGGGWADIDILAYHPEKKVFVISESKVRGPKRDVYAYTNFSRKKYGDIFEYDEVSYLSFLKNIKLICSNRGVFKEFKRMVKKVIIQLVSNYYIDDLMMPKVKKDIFRKIKNSIPSGIEIEISLDTTFHIICQIIKLEKSSLQGRRYGHPVIDIARELNRYLIPNVKYGGG
ncbi:MAG: hypothetical protein ABSH06_27165 [Thermodesulfobacteriota bacterium]|jgi:hypothetical protein